MPAREFDDQPPQEARLSAYDQRHLTTYLRLLDAEKDGASWQDAAAIIFGIDPLQDPARAKQIHDSHLARAKWMTRTGYRHLLDAPSD